MLDEQILGECPSARRKLQGGVSNFGFLVSFIAFELEECNATVVNKPKISGLERVFNHAAHAVLGSALFS